MNITTIPQLSPLALLLFLLVSAVLPLASSLLTTTAMPDEVRGILTLLLAGVTGVVTEAAKAGDGFDWRAAVKTALVAFIVAVAGRVALWRSGTNLTPYGTSWAAMLRQSLTDGSPQSFALDSSAAATGVLVLSLTGTQTAAMNTDSKGVTVWRFDLQASGGTVTPQTPFKGSVSVYGVYTHG
jgi:hypothetical protein